MTEELGGGGTVGYNLGPAPAAQLQERWPTCGVLAESQSKDLRDFHAAKLRGKVRMVGVDNLLKLQRALRRKFQLAGCSEDEGAAEEEEGEEEGEEGEEGTEAAEAAEAAERARAEAAEHEAAECGIAEYDATKDGAACRVQGSRGRDSISRGNTVSDSGLRGSCVGD